MGNTIKPHLETAKKTGACQLSKMGLSEFPPELRGLVKNLRTLDLSDNKLSQLPSDINIFTMLKSLSLNGNRLTSLPDSIGELKKLETLHLNSNRITRLPQSMNQLNQLRTISLSNNNIKEFPVQLGGLRNLDSVNLTHNSITTVPDDVKNLMAVEINLNQNQIASLSECVADCPRLKVLRVEENCLDLTVFSTRIMKESQISLLATDGNLFDQKAFHQLDGYDEYMERYTATKKKFA